MTDMLGLHRRAVAGFGQKVHAVRDDQWADPTPCTDWDVRTLVNHLVVEQLWVPPLLAGATIEQVGNRFDGDQLGTDSVGAWDSAANAALAALAEDGALARTVHLSYGDTPAESYCYEMTSDLLIHGWDLTRATGGDETLDPELAGLVYERTLPYAESMHESGLFAPPVPVPADADLSTRLLALFGRRM